LANESIQVAQALPKKYDCFIQTHYFSKLTPELMESIEATQKLVVVGDYAGEKQLYERWNSQLKDNGLGNVSCIMISPFINQVQGTIIDLVYEQ